MKDTSSRPSIKDVAAAAGVSIATVHCALYGKGRVAEGTRKRVQEAADQLGYRPNLLGRALRNGHTNTIGVVVPVLNMGLYADMVEGIHEAAIERDYSVLLGCSQARIEREQELVETFLAQGVSGLLVLPVNPTHNAEFFQKLTHSEVPHAFLHKYLPDSSWDWVTVDDFFGGEMAGEHLASLGRRRLAFVANHPPSGWGQQRRAGLDQVLKTRGLPASHPLWLQEGRWDTWENGSYEATLACFREGRRFDGVFAANDGMAFGVLRALEQCGLRVPEDVSVVGFDDVESCTRVRPSLTSFRQPMAQIGAEAVRLVLNRLEEGGAGPPQRLLLPPSLVVRKSSPTMALAP